MFRFHKPLDVLTLFHAPKVPASQCILELLKKRETTAEKTTVLGKNPRPLFELDIVEAPAVPTPTQLKSILEFVGEDEVKRIVKGAGSEKEAVKLLEEEGEIASERFLRPLVVDWNNGRAVLGADEKAVKNLVDTLPK